MRSLATLGQAASAWCVAALAALVLHALSDLPFWGCLAIAVGCMFVIGWVAEWEDNQPGGFNHPTPDDPSTPTPPRSNDRRNE